MFKIICMKCSKEIIVLNFGLLNNVIRFQHNEDRTYIVCECGNIVKDFDADE